MNDFINQWNRTNQMNEFSANDWTRTVRRMPTGSDSTMKSTKGVIDVGVGVGGRVEGHVLCTRYVATTCIRYDRERFLLILLNESTH